MYNKSIICRNPPVIKGINIGFMLLWLFGMLSKQFGDNLFAWMVWFYLLIRLPLMFPDLVVYDEGIEVKRFFVKHFLFWSDISDIYRGSIHVRIYPKNIPFFIKLIIYESFFVMFWCKNFEEAIQNMTHKLNQSPP